jgi:hypothetical protein
MNTLHGLLMAAAPSICPQAPGGLQAFADQLTGNAKWAVIAVLGIAFFAGVALMIWGRLSHHPKGARLGFEVLLVCLGAAILYAGGYAILTGIVGTGC